MRRVRRYEVYSSWNDRPKCSVFQKWHANNGSSPLTLIDRYLHQSRVRPAVNKIDRFPVERLVETKSGFAGEFGRDSALHRTTIDPWRLKRARQEVDPFAIVRP